MKGRYVKLDSAKMRWHRDRLGWTLDTLAEQAEVAEGTALRAEHGEDIRPSSGRRIARALGVDISELVPDQPGVVRPKEPAAPPPSREWAVGAPEEEFNSWVETASLHDTLTLNRELSEIAAGETAETDEHRHLLRRLGKVAEHFIAFGPFKLVETSRTRRAAAAREDQERRKGQETA
jgi:transcriptional regulator with XRE-family HTH domain